MGKRRTGVRWARDVVAAIRVAEVLLAPFPEAVHCRDSWVREAAADPCREAASCHPVRAETCLLRVHAGTWHPREPWSEVACPVTPRACHPPVAYPQGAPPGVPPVGRLPRLLVRPWFWRFVRRRRRRRLEALFLSSFSWLIRPCLSSCLWALEMSDRESM